MVLTVTNGAPFFSMVALVQLAFCIHSTVQAGVSDCPPGASLDLTNAERNTSGFVSESGHFFPESKTKNDQNGVLRGCICDVKPCLALCPPKGAEPGRTIVVDDYVNYEAIPEVYTANATPDDEVNAVGPKGWFHILVRHPCPKSKYFHLEPEAYQDDKFYLLRKGSLFWPKNPFTNDRILGFEKYCLDLEPNKTIYTPVLCFETDKVPNWVKKTRYVAHLLSVPFIIATVIVYSVIPRLKNIHGTTLRCYLCCLTVTNIALPLDRIFDPDYEIGPWCFLVGFTIYFSIISGFLWLNVMCLDLWWRFGGCGSFRSTGTQQDGKKFMWYSIYVWGISVLMIAICIGMEFAPGSPESMIRPGFTSGRCWFGSDEAYTLYYIGPICLIIFSNIVLFVLTAIKLAQHKKQTQRDFNSRTSIRHNHKKQWFGVYLRLCVAMGICWSTEVISWVWNNAPTYLLYVTGMIKALQGILIFVIFVCKKTIWISLKEHYGKKILTSSQGVGSEWKLKRMTSQFIDTSEITREDTITKFSTTSE